MNPLLHKIKSRVDAVRLKLFYLFFVKMSLSRRKKRILIVKNDSIGDYIISRNFLAETLRSEKFKDHELYLLTSQKLAPIVSQLDGKLLKEIIVSKSVFSSTAEQIQYYKLLKSYGFDYILHPTYSPDSWTQYHLKYTDGGYKIGFDGDTSNQTPTDKLYFEQYYSQLIPAADKFSHEFEKNVVFFNAVLGQPVTLQKPELKMAQGISTKKQIAVCPGAQQAFRIWSLEKFGELITLLHASQPAYGFVVVTGPGEDALYEGIAAATAVSLSHFKIDSIINLISLISASELVVCNDSSSAHIAVACNINNVCISNGNHFRRFVPYPDTMPVKQQVIAPPELLNDLHNGNANKYYAGSTLDINGISVDTVFNACERYLLNT